MAIIGCCCGSFVLSITTFFCSFLLLAMFPTCSTTSFQSQIPLQSIGQPPKSLDVMMDAKFDPYSDNAGTTLALAGKDFCIIAADTRLSDRYMIRSRGICRICEVNDRLVLTGSGCWSDMLELGKVLNGEAKKYEYTAKKPMNVRVLSHIISNILYSRRFFPYYTFSTIAGIDEEGHGAVFHYDALGSGQRVRAACAGRGEKMIQPLLDELTNVEEDESLWELSESEDEFVSINREVYISLGMEEAVGVVVKAFRAAAERETSIGDGLDVWILRKAEEGGHPSDGIERAHSYVCEKRRFALPRQ